MNKHNTKIQDYLVGKVLPNKHDNILGAVLGFNKKLSFNETTKKYDLIAILLFLDFRTGRVERYLVNSSNIHPNKGIDLKEDLYFTWEGERYKIFYEKEHSPTEEASLTKIGNGILNREFYFIFMTELARDYFLFFKSFNDGNISSLRKNTGPLEIAEIGNNESVGLGTGKISKIEYNLLKDSNEYKSKDFIAFNAHNFINIPKKNNKKMTIFVPINLKNKMIEKYFAHVNIQIFK